MNEYIGTVKEIWEDVKRYESLYKVSNIGNVKSLKKKVLRRNKGIYVTYKPFTLKKILGSRGYVIVGLGKNYIWKTHRVHRLVAQAFIPNPENKTQINHIDSDRTNNNVDNLEWCTPQENTQHAFKKGTVGKLAVHKDVIKAYLDYNTQVDVANKYGISRQSVYNILKRYNVHIRSYTYKGKSHA